MACVEYDFYANEYLGEAISPRDFPRLAARASAYVRAMTRGRSGQAQSPKDQEAVRRAVCAAAEAFQDEERLLAGAFSAEPALSSETVGSWSRTYQSTGLSAAQLESLRQRKREAVTQYLRDAPAFAGLFGVQGYRCGGRV